MRLLAIDPGPLMSAWVLYDVDAGAPLGWAKEPNAHILAGVIANDFDADQLAVEVIASYGMAVGADVFETCIVVGRLMQAWELAGNHDPNPVRVKRLEVKMHLCHSARAKDANVRQALIDRYGGKEAAIGRKASPGPLYGLSGDGWAALGVAVTVADRMALERAA